MEISAASRESYEESGRGAGGMKEFPAYIMVKSPYGDSGKGARRGCMPESYDGIRAGGGEGWNRASAVQA